MTLKSGYSETQKIMLAQRLCGWLFVFLCLLHFFSQRPLWLDEDFVLTNIKELNFVQIFGPLKHAQGFPRLHLSVIKIFSQFFGYHVFSLRIFSLAAMLGAYFIWQKIYRQSCGETWESVWVMLSFSGSYAMSYYAAELKPYAMDVLVAGLFTLAIMKQAEVQRQGIAAQKFSWLQLLPLLLLFSYGGLFFLLWPFFNFLILCRNYKSVRLIALIYFFVAIAVFLFVHRFDLRFAAQEKALVDYWESYLLCTRSWGCFWETFGEGLRRISAWSFGYGKIFLRWGTFLIPFFLYGVGRYGFAPWLKARGRIFSLPVLGAAVLFFLFVISLLKIFPFTGDRITLFLCPYIFYYIVRGMADLKRYRPVYYFFLGNYLIFLLGCVIYSIIIYLGRYQQFAVTGV